eukprot:SAG22_NODE_815_length_7037_cov_6.192130_3_plen_437_part_00
MRPGRYEHIIKQRDLQLTLLRKALWVESKVAPQKKDRARAAKSFQAQGELEDIHKSPNTLGNLRAFQKSSGKARSQLDLVWAFVFRTPVWTEEEQVLAADKRAADRDAEDDRPVSHECWMFCEEAMSCDLDILPLVPIDGKTIIIALSAPLETLVDEANTTRILMRLQETKGSLEFHSDLIRYYASNHGGLNEWVDDRWIKRNPNLVADGRHWKPTEELSDLERKEQDKMDANVFTSGLAQRLVMSRLQRRARYIPDQMMQLQSGHALTYIMKRSGVSTGGKQQHIAATYFTQALLCIGGYRPGAAQAFGKVSDGNEVPDIAKLTVSNPNFVLRPDTPGTAKKQNPISSSNHFEMSYEKARAFVQTIETWKAGYGREETWVGTLKQYLPLHNPKELHFLKKMWGTPSMIFRGRITGYAPEVRRVCPRQQLVAGQLL